MGRAVIDANVLVGLVRDKDALAVAKVFYDGYQDLIDIEIKLEEKLERLAWKIFSKQTKKGTSFVDCANLAMMEMYKLDGVVT